MAVLDLHIAGEAREVRLAGETLGRYAKGVGIDDGVGVDRREDPPLGGGDRGVQGRRLPAVSGQHEGVDGRVLLGEGPRERGGSAASRAQ